MYPFTLLGLDPDVSDAEVVARYHSLVERYPPDLEPEVFGLLTEAYTQLKDANGRLKTRVFYASEDLDAFSVAAKVGLAFDTNKRMSHESLVHWLKAQH